MSASAGPGLHNCLGEVEGGLAQLKGLTVTLPKVLGLIQL